MKKQPIAYRLPGEKRTRKTAGYASPEYGRELILRKYPDAIILKEK